MNATEAHARLARAKDKLAVLAQRRLHAVSQALQRSRALTGEESVILGGRVELLAAAAMRPAGSQHLRLSRELDEIDRARLQAEAALSAVERRARSGLDLAAALLREVAPSLPLSSLLLEVPLDPGMGDRLEAVVGLIRARREIVPRLLAARPAWKR